MPANGDRRSDARNEHICGRTSAFIYNEYRPASEISEISRPTNRISASTSETTCGMDIDFNGNRRQPGPTDNSKRILANRTTGNYKDLIRGVTNRDQTNKERVNTVATGDRLKVQPSLPTGQGEEIDSKSGTLAIRQLCRNKQLDPSGILQARFINQLPFDRQPTCKNCKLINFSIP